MIQSSLLKDTCEIVHYDNVRIPLYIKQAWLSSYTNMTALCHWHDDMEYIKILKGHMSYYINGRKTVIQENDGLLINTRQMYYGFSEDGTDCEFLCILFNPQTIWGNSEIHRVYVKPVLDYPLTERCLNAQNPDDAVLIRKFDEIHEIYKKQENGFELNIIASLNQFWQKWYALLQPEIEKAAVSVNEEILIQKEMTEFIYLNYKSKIRLADIAQAGGVCRSKCCLLFQKYLQKTPLEFLNAYRLEISMKLLRNTSVSITEIALSCGFNSPSYFSEIFNRYKGCTPGDYRQFQKNTL